MFLHKYDILNRNLNVLFQNVLPVVTKLCAVTKLGDLTVLFFKVWISPFLVGYGVTFDQTVWHLLHSLREISQIMNAS